MEPFTVRASGWTRWLHRLARVAGWDTAEEKERHFCGWIRHVIAGTIMAGGCLSLIATVWYGGTTSANKMLSAHEHIGQYTRYFYAFIMPPVAVLAIILIIVMIAFAVLGCVMLYRRVRGVAGPKKEKELPNIVKAWHAIRDRYCIGIVVEEKAVKK